MCTRDDRKWIGAAYFPRGQQSFSDIESKFKDDLQGVAGNEAEGIAFVTNQELSLRQREQLMETASPIEGDLFHLERIASILDSPLNYGIRLEFLDIEMAKEEQLAFIAARDRVIAGLQQEMSKIASYVNQSETLREEFERIRAADVPKEPFYVTPTPLSNPYSVASLFQDRVHRCSKCGHGYFIRSTGSVTIGLDGITGQAMAITCPSCGNVEEYYPPSF